MSRLKNILIYYYGGLQVLHWVANLFVIHVDQKGAIGLVTSTVNEEIVTSLMTSANMDFYLASPLGILFLYGFLRKKDWASDVGFVSLAIAFISAIIYDYVLVFNGAWEFTVMNIVIHVAFAPAILLFGLSMIWWLRGKDYLKVEK